MPRHWAICALFLSVIGITPPISHAGGFERIDVTYDMTANGDVSVTEIWEVETDRPTGWWYRTLPRDGYQELRNFRIRDNYGLDYDVRYGLLPMPPEESGVCHVVQHWLQYEIAWRQRPNEAPLAAGSRVAFTMEYTLVAAVQQGLRRDWLTSQPILSRRDGSVKLGRVTLHLPAPVEKFRVDFECDSSSAAWWAQKDPPTLFFEAADLAPQAPFIIRLDMKNGVVGPPIQGVEWVATNQGLAVFVTVLIALGYLATRPRRSALYEGRVLPAGKSQ